MFPDHIETERLRLERISHDTVDVFAPHDFYSPADGAEEMFEYWDSPPHRSVKETYEYLDEAERLWEEAEGAKYVIRPKDEEGGGENRPRDEEGDEVGDDGVIAGTTGLYPDWEKRSANLGVILDRQYWGRGYSGERAGAILDVAFDRLGLELVVASHVDGNERSRRAIDKYVERFGGQYDGLFRNWLPVGESVADVRRYTISREEYLDAIER